MISALLYLQYHSFRNRLFTRCKRLKQPKYLVGAIVGGLYFYFYFFRYVFFVPGRQRSLGTLGLSPEHLLLVESLGALALFVTVLMAWLIPHERAALTFSEAEVAFLFPAPISRRGLVHFKLVRSQVRILFTVLFLTLITNRGGNALMHAAGWWLILSTLSLHFLGSSFARTILLDRGITNWLRRTLILSLAVLLAGIVVVWAQRTMPEFNWSRLSDAGAAANPAERVFDTLSDYAQRVLTSGPALYVLYPFRLLVRPYLARDLPAFLIALGPALLLLLLHYAWVVYSNVAFEEASVEASQKLAVRIAAARAGNVQGAMKKQKGRRALFRLAPTGPPAVALLWKNLISAGQAFTGRLWLIIIVLGVCLYAGLGNSLHSAELFSGLTVLIGVVLGWSLLFGPQLFRQDLRQDLPLADVLKAYPLRGWQIVLGELLAPVAILTAAQWLLVIFGAGFLLHARGMKDGPLPLAIAFAAVILLPLLDLLLLLIPNAAVLLFPSWIQTGREGPRGIEVTGQRLILMLGQLLVFAVALLPAAIIFLVLFFVIKLALGLAVAVPLASVATAVVLGLEVGLGVMLLGRLFERFDLSVELSP
jgi:hypothetical protein